MNSLLTYPSAPTRSIIRTPHRRGNSRVRFRRHIGAARQGAQTYPTRSLVAVANSAAGYLHAAGQIVLWRSRGVTGSAGSPLRHQLSYRRSPLRFTPLGEALRRGCARISCYGARNARRGRAAAASSGCAQFLSERGDSAMKIVSMSARSPKSRSLQQAVTSQ
jgi:hypothetical protein